MKRILLLLLVLASLFQPVRAQNLIDPQLPEDRGVVVLEQSTGQVLYALNAQEKRYPASLTKLLTALVVLDHNQVEDTLVPGAEMDAIPSSSSRAFLIHGKSISIKDALAGLLLPSGGDAAMALAVHTARVEQKDPKLSVDRALARFSDLMNAKAEALGMTQSHFSNPHGLHAEDHYTTAEDLALLAQAALKDPLLKSLVGNAEYTSEDGQYTFASTNVYLHPRLEDVWFLYKTGPNPNYRKDVTGVKTGFTQEAGRCLIFTTQLGDVSLLGVLLHSDMSSVYEEGIRIMDGVEKELEWFETPAEWTKQQEIPVDGPLFLPGKTLELNLPQLEKQLYPKTWEENLDYSLKITTEKLVYSEKDKKYKLLEPLEEGEVVGVLERAHQGQILDARPVAIDHELSPMDLWLLPAVFLIALFLVLLVVLQRRNRRIRRIRRKRMKIKKENKW